MSNKLPPRVWFVSSLLLVEYDKRVTNFYGFDFIVILIKSMVDRFSYNLFLL